MTLPALDQHFLVHHYNVSSAADALASEETAAHLARSWYGGAGPDRASFDTDSRGIHYTMPGEDRLGEENCWRHAHRITWSQLRGHRKAQPARLVDELIEAMAESTRESRRHREATDAISAHGYRGATDEQRAALDAERAAHYSADATLRARVRAAVVAILPLHDVDPDEPTDLIGWAEVLAP